MNEQGEQVKYCPFCGALIWGEGWNGATGERFYSHQRNTKVCFNEIAMKVRVA